MKTSLTIEVKVDVAKIITALSGFVLVVAHLAGYF
jgi:hypothetical protein